MQQELFADGIGAIALSNGVVRIDLVSLSTSPAGDQQPVAEFRQRIIMSPDGFLKSFAAMQNLVAELEKANIIKRTEPQGTSGQEAAAVVVPASPNFQ